MKRWADIKRALALEPDNPSYLDSLGWVYFKLEQFDLAEAPLSQASQALTTNSVVQDHWGDLLAGSDVIGCDRGRGARAGR